MLGALVLAASVAAVRLLDNYSKHVIGKVAKILHLIRSTGVDAPGICGNGMVVTVVAMLVDFSC